ncbi:hypothetical protein MGWOODY_Smn1605 [hydrothermal vent metagenome]|uniref:Uncharacterized protein n=1 Tax=hydrothermal vent metagenome TaxID=652676 RepID=A0A160TLC5_9ZZZZ
MRAAFEHLELDATLGLLAHRALDRGHELAGDGARDLERRLVRADADRADLVLGDVPAAADQRQDPARIGVLAAADIHAEPHDIVEALAVVLLAGWLGRPLGQHLFRSGQARAIGLDQRRRDVLGRLLLHELRGERAIVVIDLDRLEQHFHQAGAVRLADVVCGGRIDPFDRDPRAAQHHLDPAPALIGDDQDGRALLARAAGAARTVLKRLGIARQLDMDDQAERRQVDAARGDVGRDADPGALVAQRLHRRVALVLGMLARQGDSSETALDQAGMEMADIVARRAEQHRRFGLVQAEQVDHGILDIGRGDGDRLVADVAVAAILAHRRNAQRIALVALGERDDRLGHGRREEQCAALIGRRVEDLLEILAEAHVEHLVGLVEDDCLERAEIERAALDMVAQAARRADDDMRAARQGAAFARRVHAADTGGDARAGLFIQPAELAADLERKLTGRRDGEGERRAGRRQRAFLAEKLRRDGEAEGDRLAGTGLCRDDHVAALGLRLDHRGLDWSGRGVATGGERFGEKRGQM